VVHACGGLLGTVCSVGFRQLQQKSCRYAPSVAGDSAFAYL